MSYDDIADCIILPLFLIISILLILLDESN